MDTAVPLSTRIAYLQRTNVTFSISSRNKAKETVAPPNLRQLFRIDSVSHLDNTALDPARSANPMTRLVSEDLVIGLYGRKIPLAFLVSGEPDGVAIHLGTWSPEKGAPTIVPQDDQQTIMRSMLRGLYPGIETRDVDAQLSPCPKAGIVFGIPTAKLYDPFDQALPLDRLIRSLSGAHWTVLVLAQPMGPEITSDLRNDVVAEMSNVAKAVERGEAKSAVAERYIEMLEIALKELIRAQAVGAWRTGVYLLSDQVSYNRLVSVWSSIFSGEQSLPEPIRVWEEDTSYISSLAVDWALPDESATSLAGCKYKHKYQYQTLLSSSQLATYVHLPRNETSGFGIRIFPRFDVIPPPVSEVEPALEPTPDQGDQAVSLGWILEGNQPTKTIYTVGLAALKSHSFVTGVTGIGKTNTIFHLLKQAARLHIPFLVMEAAKTEYRALLTDPSLKQNLQIFTLGTETVAPFRVNPFEVVGWRTKKTSVGVHLDMLRSVFVTVHGGVKNSAASGSHP